MRVLITGANGYLGSKLTQVLWERAHKVFTFAGCVTNRTNWLYNIAHTGPDVVVHLAAMTSLRECEKNPDQAKMVNYDSVVMGLKLCNNKSRFVLASTPTVAGVTHMAEPMPETDHEHCYPDNVYDETKYYAEMMTLKYGQTVFRLSNVYGASIAESKKDRGIVNQFVRKGLRGETIQVYESVAGCWRDFIHLSDVIDAFVMFIETPKIRSGVFNVCSGDGHTMLDMAKMCGETTIIPDPSEPLFPIETRSWVGDHDKLTGVSKWKPRVSLEEGIELTKKALR